MKNFENINIKQQTINTTTMAQIKHNKKKKKTHLNRRKKGQQLANASPAPWRRFGAVETQI